MDTRCLCNLLAYVIQTGDEVPIYLFPSALRSDRESSDSKADVPITIYDGAVRPSPGCWLGFAGDEERGRLRRAGGLRGP